MSCFVIKISVFYLVYSRHCLVRHVVVIRFQVPQVGRKIVAHFLFRVAPAVVELFLVHIIVVRLLV